MRSCTLGFVAALSFAAPCLAQDPCLKAPDAGAAAAVRFQFTLKRTQNCYDVKNHAPSSLDSAVKLLDKADKQQALAERRRTIASLLDALRNWTQTNVGDSVVREPLQRNLHGAVAALDAGELSKDVANPTSWTVNHRPKDDALVSKVSGPADLAARIDASCPGVATCAAAIADLEAVLRSHAVAEAALMVARKEELSDLADLFSKRAAMWDAYRTEARPQYPWEWLLNGVLYRDDRARDAANNPIGPANLPRGQWILLHPGVGLERFDIRGSDQSASNPTLYIEWAGYNRLNWDYDAGKLRGGLGISFVSVYASRHDAKDWSHGLMFWVSNKYGVAATRNSEGTSLMVSVDVGELLRDQLNQLNQKLPGLPSR
jgi:hypothetical protein